MPETSNDPVEVYRARGLADAHTLRLLLDAEGIPAWVDNELLQGALGDIPLGWATAPRVLVGRGDEAAARAVVEQFTREHATAGPAGELACLACRSPMGEADTCPACGWSYLSEPATAAPQVAVPAAPMGEEEDPLPFATSPTPPLSRGDLWGEVAAVLAIGIVP
jgi:hypothetical protein